MKNIPPAPFEGGEESAECRSNERTEGGTQARERLGVMYSRSALRGEGISA